MALLWTLQWRGSHKKIKLAKTAVSLFPKGIDVQWLRPDINTLAENWMPIYLRVFNGTRFTVRVDLQTEGVMLLDDRHKVQPVSLRAAIGNNDPVAHGNSALFILVLTLHPDEAKQLSNVLDNGKLVCFSYNTFKIHITAIDDHGHDTAQIRSDLPFTGTGLTISNGLVVECEQVSAGVSC